MTRILKKLAALTAYLVLMSFFLGFQIGKLIDSKQFGIWLLGTGLLLLPSFLEKTAKETRRQKWQRAVRCSFWAGLLESFLLCLGAMEQMKGTEAILPEFALCLRPVFYSVCVCIIFAEQPKQREKPGECVEKGTFYEITASESYALFQEMGLTKRECETAILVCQGMSNGEIAEDLCISEATVKKHISNIFEKLGCSRREQIRKKLFSINLTKKRGTPLDKIEHKF